jgi:hypothetical protein
MLYVREKKSVYQGSSLETLNERDYTGPKKYLDGLQYT